EGVGTLDRDAPTAGCQGALASDTPAVAEVPATATALSGSRGAGFPVTTHPVAVSTEIHITASAGGVTRTTTLTLLPFGLAAVTLDPASVVGGNPTTGS